MKKNFFVLGICFLFGVFIRAETVDVSTSVPAKATLLGIAEMTVNVKNVSDNLVTSTITWTNVPSTTSYKEAEQYVEIKYNDNYYSWAIRVYTDNTNWGGAPGNQGGLIHTATNTIRLPLLWRVYDEPQTGGVQCSTTTGWAFVKDKNDSDWNTAKTGYANVCYGGPDYTNLADFPSSGRTDTDLQDIYIYLGAEFKSAASGDYSGNIYFDLYHN